MTESTLTVEAAATREHTPELASVEVSAVGEGESVSAARAVARDRAQTIKDAVTTAPTDRIQTVDVCVEDTDEVFGTDGNAAYHATEKIQIGCAAETAEDVVTEVTDAGGQIQMVGFHADETVCQQLRADALAAATEQARRKADAIAAVERLSITHIEEITAQAESQTDNFVDAALECYDDENLYPAPVEVSESITVTYAIEAETA